MREKKIFDLIEVLKLPHFNNLGRVIFIDVILKKPVFKKRLKKPCYSNTRVVADVNIHFSDFLIYIIDSLIKKIFTY